MGCSPALPPLDNHAERNARIARHHAVVSANVHASDIGLDILRRGGNAMDAAIATKIALTLLEPHETGLGGGGFLLYYDARTQTQTVYDGRETAPEAATESYFTWLGLPMHHYLAVTRGRAVGVPGMLAMLERAHQDHGQLPWATLFEATIQLAEDGVPMPPRLQRQYGMDRSLNWFSDMRRYLSVERSPHGPYLHNPALAATLREFAEHGSKPLYEGHIGEQIRDRAAKRWPWRAQLNASDFADYRPVTRDSLCADYRGWTVCTAAAPSSAGVTILQILGMLEHFDIESMRPDSPKFVHLLAEASRLAFADRQYHLGDPAFVRVDEQDLIDPRYLAARAALIDPNRAMVKANPGIPGEVIEVEDAPPVEEDEEMGTSHLNVVDAAGNAVALTGSIEAPFGSRMMAAGLMLNNQLTDFDFISHKDGLAMPNRVEAGKRPRSSMAPTLVFNPQGELAYVIGSRGGSRIIGYVVKTLIGTLDWRLNIQRSIDLPNVLHRGERLELEKGTNLEERAEALRALGHQVSVEALESGIHGLERVDDGWRGGADRRMEGALSGE